MKMMTLLRLRREFSMKRLKPTKIANNRIRRGSGFKWNLSPYRARDSIMRRVRKKILN
jgi:hypothetical protein